MNMNRYSTPASSMCVGDAEEEWELQKYHLVIHNALIWLNIDLIERAGGMAIAAVGI